MNPYIGNCYGFGLVLLFTLQILQFHICYHTLADEVDEEGSALVTNSVLDISTEEAPADGTSAVCLFSKTKSTFLSLRVEMDPSALNSPCKQSKTVRVPLQTTCRCSVLHPDRCAWQNPTSLATISHTEITNRTCNSTRWDSNLCSETRAVSQCSKYPNQQVAC